MDWGAGAARRRKVEGDSGEPWVSLNVVQVRDPNAVAKLREEWRALQAQSPGLTPFQTWEWNDAYWSFAGAGKRPSILLFYENGGRGNRPVGLAPLCMSLHPIPPARRLTWIGTGPSDYLGPIVLPGREEDVADAFFTYLQRSLRGWDVADLQDLRPDSPLMNRALRPWPDRPARIQHVLPTHGCPYVPLPSTWEEYARGLSKRMRSNIGRAERAAQAAFPDLRLSLASRDTLKEGMNAFFALHQARWLSLSRPGIFRSPRVRSFHLDVARRFLENGWLRLCLLHARGAPRAAEYWFAIGGRWFSYAAGFDPTLAKYRLGTILLAWGLRRAILEGCMEADFLRGEEAYKDQWRPKSRMSHRIVLVRPRGGPGRIGELPGMMWWSSAKVVRRVRTR